MGGFTKYLPQREGNKKQKIEPAKKKKKMCVPNKFNEKYGHRCTINQDNGTVHIFTFTWDTKLIPISNKRTITITKTWLDEWILRLGFWKQKKTKKQFNQT